MLADHFAMSVRNFERVFTRELGRTPSKYILQVRVEEAQRQLERTDRGLKQIALHCGFGSADVTRRSFVRLIGVTPNQYRRTSYDQPVSRVELADRWRVVATPHLGITSRLLVNR